MHFVWLALASSCFDEVQKLSKIASKPQLGNSWLAQRKTSTAKPDDTAAKARRHVQWKIKHNGKKQYQTNDNHTHTYIINYYSVSQYSYMMWCRIQSPLQSFQRHAGPSHGSAAFGRAKSEPDSATISSATISLQPHLVPREMWQELPVPPERLWFLTSVVHPDLERFDTVSICLPYNYIYIYFHTNTFSCSLSHVEPSSGQ